MRNGWTGGQYSVYRALLGVYLVVHFLHLLPYGTEVFSDRGALGDGSASPLLGLFPNVLGLFDAPGLITLVLSLGAVAGACLAVGIGDRVAAILAWYLLACLFGRNPLTANPSMPFVGMLLLTHACLPKAPFGSWAARGRTDPGGSWVMTPALFAVLWIVMSVGYAYSGATKLVSPSWIDGSAFAYVLENPLAREHVLRGLLLELPPWILSAATWGGLGLELAFIPLAAFRRTRPWAWGSMVAIHLGLLVLVDFADLTLGMLLLHAFTFDPAWLAPRRAGTTDRVFYDGTCGVCHGAVRTLLSEDRSGSAFRFAPLFGTTFEEVIPAGRRVNLPDSIVVATESGETLVRGDAALHLLGRLGGLWRALAAGLTAIPSPVRNAIYDTIARHRKRWVAAPKDACPLLPPHLAALFDA